MLLHPSVFFYCHLVLFALSASLANTQSGPIVNTKTFSVRGTTVAVNNTWSPLTPTNNVSTADAFYAVPFAQPPVGVLRFEKPRPPTLNNSVMLDCSNASTMLACIPQQIVGISGLTISEDCLTLGILRPTGTTNTSQLPVLVNIHGGGWLGSSGIMYMPPNDYDLLNYYIPQNVLVVVIQYRLHVFGFGSDGTSSMPGNLGLFDQQLALKWIYENVASFGGDPTKITLIGPSAGGASLSFHTLNTVSSQYFTRVVQISGSINNPWAYDPKDTTTVPYTLQVASAVGCNQTAGTPELKECLKSADTNAISNASSALTNPRTDFALFNFAPRHDGDFINTSTVAALLANASPKPSIIGFSSDEGLSWTRATVGSGKNNAWTVNITKPSDADNYTMDQLADFIDQNVLPGDSSLKSELIAIIARAAITRFYTREDNRENATLIPAFNFMQLTRLVSDIVFIIPVLWEARAKAQSGWPIYLFHFDHITPYVASLFPYPAIYHCADLPYDSLFPGSMFQFDANDTAVQAFHLGRIVNFIKSGNPNSDSDLQWPLLNFGEHLECDGAKQHFAAMNMNPTPYVESQQRPGGSEIVQRLDFWDDLSAIVDLGRLHNLQNTMDICVPDY